MEDDELETLVAAAATGDDAAWQRLWATIEPLLSRVVAQPRFLGRLGGREDDRRNIVLDVMDRLHDHQFARLGMYLEARAQNPRLKFMSWLRVVAKRVGIDYLRSHPDYVRRHDKDASRPGVWIDAGTLPPGSQLFGERPPITNRGTARELLQFAAGAVDTVQYRALEQWTQGESFEDIARTLGLASTQAAERMVRAVIERIRRKYRPSEDPPP